jgi:hypothetical protein
VKRKIYGYFIAATIVSLPLVVGAQRNRPTAWPSKGGVYLATASQTIPAFPRTLAGFRSTGNLDYWDHSLRFSLHGSTRIFEGNGWERISDDFPMTMNHCSDGAFMLRWRSANPKVRITSAVGYHFTNQIYAQKTGAFGYMQGSNCEEPLFKFVGSSDTSTLVDIYYELKFWRAAP